MHHSQNLLPFPHCLVTWFVQSVRLPDIEILTSNFEILLQKFGGWVWFSLFKHFSWYLLFLWVMFLLMCYGQTNRCSVTWICWAGTPLGTLLALLTCWCTSRSVTCWRAPSSSSWTPWHATLMWVTPSLQNTNNIPYNLVKQSKIQYVLQDWHKPDVPTTDISLFKHIH